MREKPVTISRRKYDAAFKEQVLQMVFNGRPVSEVARSLEHHLPLEEPQWGTEGKKLLRPGRNTRHCTGGFGSWKRSEKF